jgi:hypothetical protein
MALIRSTMPKADFYFLNPYGIMFGPRCEVRCTKARFTPGTADYLSLGEGGYFDARNSNGSTLTVAPVEAFGFLEQPESIEINGSFIEINGSFLETPAGKTLSIVGGDIFINDGVLFAESGRINLASVAMAGEVIPTPNDLQVTATEKGTIEIIQSSWSNLRVNENINKDTNEVINEAYGNLDVSDFNSKGGGQIFIRAGQLILDKALIYAITYGETGSKIDVSVDGDIELYNGASITADSCGSESITCNASEGNQVTVISQEGHISLRYLNTDAYDAIVSEIGEEKAEILKDIIDEGYDEEYEEYEDEYSTEEIIEIAIRDAIGDLDTDRALEAIKDGITDPEADFLSLEPQNTESTIATNNFGSGEGGDIQISTGSLELEDASISAATEGYGNAGHIQINAQEINLPYYGYITTRTNSLGKGGDITIRGFNQPQAESISIANDSSITASSDVRYVEGKESGHAGNIDIKTQHLNLESGGSIYGFSYDGTGHAGTIRIEADTAFSTGEESGIYTESDTGGGDIYLTIHDSLELDDNSWITAEAFGKSPQDKGGNITIGKKLSSDPDAPWENTGIFTLKNSRLLANAYAGNGGEIKIYTDDFQGENSEIDVSSRFNLNGKFQVNGIEFQENYSLLPSKFSSIPALVSCPPVSLDELPSSFKLKGRGGLLDLPGQLRSGSLLDFSVNGISE